MDIHDIPAWLALFVSFVVLGFQLRDYFVPLRMEVTDLHVAEVVGNTYILLFRLSLTNNSSRGKVVYNILPVSRTKSVTVDKVVGKFDLSSQTASYTPSKGEGLKIPIAELLLPPLDILPHQSLNKWVVLILTDPRLQANPPHDMVDAIWFQGVDFDGKEMVGCHVRFYPTKLRPSETYDFLRSRFAPKLRISDILNSQYFLWFILLAIFILLLVIWFHNQSSYVPIIPTPKP